MFDRILAEFSVKIRQGRQACGLTQAELASRIGTSRITLNRWENGLAEPSVQSYLLLAGFFQQKAEAGGDSGRECLDASNFFFEESKSAGIRNREKSKRDMALIALENCEAGAKEGSVLDKMILADANRDPRDLVRQVFADLEAAKQTLTNGEFTQRAITILSHFTSVEMISLGRAVRAEKAARTEKFQARRLLSLQKKINILMRQVQAKKPAK